MEERIIGRFEGHKKGSLLICLGGIHGNEPAGIKAFEKILELLAAEHLTNPDFNYKGSLVGLRGNLQALEQKKRFIGRDLNRMLSQSELQRIQNAEPDNRTIEDNECIELLTIIAEEMKNYNPELTLILDFHTTTADGGIFTIAADDPQSRRFALGLHAPVVLGIAEGLVGTTIEYFNRPSDNCFCIVFEAGQHDDPECENRCVAAIVNCMRSIGSVKPRDVHHRHDDLLITYSEGLPKMARLVYHYKISGNEHFIMNPGFTNFQTVIKGEILASNIHGPLYSPADGMILMPKYQSQGEDGFFIVKPIEN